jgi:hypothetical protein
MAGDSCAGLRRKGSVAVSGVQLWIACHADAAAKKKLAAKAASKHGTDAHPNHMRPRLLHKHLA